MIKLKVNKYKKLYRREFAELDRRIKRKIPKTIITKLNNFMSKNHAPMATRKSSQIVMTEFGKLMPELMGGSADLKGSNLSYYDDELGEHVNAEVVGYNVEVDNITPFISQEEY